MKKCKISCNLSLIASKVFCHSFLNPYSAHTHLPLSVCVYLYLKWCFLRPGCRWLLETKWSWTPWTLGSRSTPARTSLWIIQAATRCVRSADKLSSLLRCFCGESAVWNPIITGLFFSSRALCLFINCWTYEQHCSIVSLSSILSMVRNRQRLTSRLEIRLNRIRFVAAREN